jgi:hypothetical protein
MEDTDSTPAVQDLPGQKVTLRIVKRSTTEIEAEMKGSRMAFPAAAENTKGNLVKDYIINKQLLETKIPYSNPCSVSKNCKAVSPMTLP